MSTLALRLPDSLHEKIKKLAEQSDISVDQFVSSAVAEKMSALMTVFLDHTQTSADWIACRLKAL